MGGSSDTSVYGTSTRPQEARGASPSRSCAAWDGLVGTCVRDALIVALRRRMCAVRSATERGGLSRQGERGLEDVRLRTRVLSLRGRRYVRATVRWQIAKGQDGPYVLRFEHSGTQSCVVLALPSVSPATLNNTTRYVLRNRLEAPTERCLNKYGMSTSHPHCKLSTDVNRIGRSRTTTSRLIRAQESWSCGWRRPPASAPPRSTHQRQRPPLSNARMLDVRYGRPTGVTMPFPPHPLVSFFEPPPARALLRSPMAHRPRALTRPPGGPWSMARFQLPTSTSGPMRTRRGAPH